MIRRRFIACIVAAVAWAVPAAIVGITLGWILVGAAVIGALATIGCEPPRRRRIRHVSVTPVEVEA